MRRRAWALPAYLATVSGVGLPLLVWLVTQVHLSFLGHGLFLLAALTAVLVAGEMAPVSVPRGDDVGDEVSISSTVALALMMLAPPGFAVAAQALALCADEVRSRRRWDRLAFNVAQYTLAIFVARVVYTGWLGYGPLEYRPGLEDGALLAALLAAGAFFVVNDTLTAVAVGLKLRVPLPRQVLGDLRAQAMTSAVLLALGPVMAIAVQATVWTLPLLLLPLVAVHRSAKMAYAREHEALHDALTGLANRALFNRRLAQVCAGAHDLPVVVLLVDVDHFKEINDTLGHQAGDLLLVEMARRLTGAVRDGDLVARLGGDEFAVLATGLADTESVQPLVLRLQEALQTSVTIKGVRVDMGASLGVAFAPGDADTADLLFQKADVALYAAKRNRGSTAFYADDEDQHSLERLSLLGELRDALDAGEIFLEYQPKQCLKTGRIVGVEALARWDHADLGVLGPARFIPLAENTGLIETVTLHLLDRGLEQLRRWNDQGLDLNLAVNLSARLLADPRLPGHIQDKLDAHGLAAHRLTLEVTESMLMADTSRAIDVLNDLNAIGVQLSIDDFGTGYSSLAYLKRFPVHELKIDKAFVMSIASDRHDAAIAAMTIELAHEFGLQVVAEGVESAAALERLEALGCDLVQGYHLARPMRSSAVAGWIRSHDLVSLASDLVHREMAS